MLDRRKWREGRCTDGRRVSRLYADMSLALVLTLVRLEPIARLYTVLGIAPNTRPPLKMAYTPERT